MSDHIARLRAFKFYLDRGQAVASADTLDALALLDDYDRLMRKWADAVSDAEIARSEADQAGMRLAEAKRLLERWHQQYQEPQTEPGDAIDDDTTTFLGLTDNETAKE